MSKVFHQAVAKKFGAMFPGTPLLISSPGTINLLGDHTDYNDGFVLSGAIDRKVVMALQIRDDDQIHLYNIDTDQNYKTDLTQLKSRDAGWQQCIVGVVDTLQKNEYALRGFNCVFASNIPPGIGFAYSAAMEGATMMGIGQLFHLEIDRQEMTRLCYITDQNFLDIDCGKTDHYVNIFGRQGNVLRFDSRSGECLYYPFDGHDHSLIICDTGIRAQVDREECQTRRRQCDEGVTAIRNLHKNIMSLRDISHYLLDQNRKIMSKAVYRRCAFVIRENIRVLNGASDIEKNEYQKFGLRISESHRDLSREYEVSSSAQDLLVKIALDIPGVLGARMLGSGFGGATVNLVETGQKEQFTDQVITEYHKQTGNRPDIYPVSFSDGCKIIK